MLAAYYSWDCFRMYQVSGKALEETICNTNGPLPTGIIDHAVATP